MTNSYAPIGWIYDRKGNLNPYHMAGKGKAYAPSGYDYTGQGNLIPEQLEGNIKEAYAPEGYRFDRTGQLKRNSKPRWEEDEMGIWIPSKLYYKEREDK